MSTQVTFAPNSAKQVPDTRPTYPVPTIAIFIIFYYIKTLILTNSYFNHYTSTNYISPRLKNLFNKAYYRINNPMNK